MSNSSIFGLKHLWYPLSIFGLTDRTFGIAAETMINTWIMMGLVVSLMMLCRFVLVRKKGLGQFIVLHTFTTLYDTFEQALPKRFNYRHFSFLTTLACFLIFSNTLSVIPFLEEPTSDLNSTVALALISFFYIQYHAIAAQGIKTYIAHFFEPVFLMFPLHVMGKLSMILSLSFRLYGNLLGGSTITQYFFGFFGQAPSSVLSALRSLLGIAMSPFIIAIFGIAEGLIQAFVFTVLTLTYLAIETQTEH